MGFLDRFTVRLGHLCAWGFIIIVMLMTYEVVARYAFNAPTIWAHEITGVIAAIAFIFGGAYCMADGSHMRITSFVDDNRPALARFSKYLSLATGSIYLAGLAFSAWRMSVDSLFRFSLNGSWDPERSGSTWNTPAPSFIKLALCLGAVLFLLVLWRKLFLKSQTVD
ncbi:MAG: TRAP transporter small permease [Pseudomonadota bacterium]